MIIWGVNADNHDASISVVDDSSCEILFAGHAERYSRVKNDPHLNKGLIDDAILYGGPPDQIVWFENPWGRRLRYLMSGQYNLLGESFPQEYMRQFGIRVPIHYSDHHASHAAGGFYTSGFDNAVSVVIDAIGEMTTASIWKHNGSNMKKLWSLKYPHSLGLFYSAVTDLVGLKPNEDEYILMGMSAYGTEEALWIANRMHDEFWRTGKDGLKQRKNFHRGMTREEFYVRSAKTDQGKYNLASAAQRLITLQIMTIIRKAVSISGCTNIVYSGGVALNCLANSFVAHAMGPNYKFWIMPNPGDAGSSLGAIANYMRKPLKWTSPMLGHEIKSQPDPRDVVTQILKTGVCGIATGRAEFGPRALGNRSLLGDPRSLAMKNRVNSIKRRQKFRPFAPAVLDRFKLEHFAFPESVMDAPYMQFVCAVKNPSELPAVTHVDGTARVQTVQPNQSPVLDAILESWLERTGCPVLLNTSLNIKGEPLVNTRRDGDRFSHRYGVKVL